MFQAPGWWQKYIESCVGNFERLKKTLQEAKKSWRSQRILVSSSPKLPWIPDQVRNDYKMLAPPVF